MPQLGAGNAIKCKIADRFGRCEASPGASALLG
jgi:hypothetical protein